MPQSKAWSMGQSAPPQGQGAAIALAVMLAGGAGRRLGGDKACRKLAGRPLAAHGLERLRAQGLAVAISAPAPVPGLDPALPLLADEASLAGRGPLAGVLAALDHAAARGCAQVLTVGCDMPFLPPDLYARLAGGLGRAEVAIARSGRETAFICALWRSPLAGALRRSLGAAPDGLSVQAFQASRATVKVDFPASHPPAFFNVNTPAELEQAQSWLAEGQDKAHIAAMPPST
ncbi:MAG: molybdenum cofactor guanylyltransferase [Pseudomonadota bacterium]